jgi:hypothetical protein
VRGVEVVFGIMVNIENRYIEGKLTNPIQISNTEQPYVSVLKSLKNVKNQNPPSFFQPYDGLRSLFFLLQRKGGGKASRTVLLYNSSL